jgi:hypothetical protein
MGNTGSEHDPSREAASTDEDRFARGDTRRYSGRSSVVAIVTVIVVLAVVYLYYHWGK